MLKKSNENFDFLGMGHAKMKRKKCENQFNEEQGGKPMRSVSRMKKLNGHKYKELFRSKARRVKLPDRVSEDLNVAEGTCSRNKSQSMSSELKQVCSCNAKVGNNLSSDTIPMAFNETDEHLAENRPSLDSKCKSYNSKFVEYWVPIPLSNVQTEQYCDLLLSKSVLLCSSLKNDSIGSLQDILILARKCCDHPNLVDSTLHSSVTQALSTVDHLNVDIEMGSKLHLLCKILSEIRERSLRVLIFFQSSRSGPVSIGDILDDFVHQKFGKDLYIRIDRDIPPKKKQSALSLFNDKEGKIFVCLLETRACLPSMKLSSVDTVILFNSDWDPLNDYRALQKITIDSQFKQIKIFRLYSSSTLEEKVLILAKEGVNLDSNMRNIKRSICHELLTWGSIYLFNKLDDFHGCDDPVSFSNISCERDLLEKVSQEVLTLLPNSGGNGGITDCSIVLEVKQGEYGYMMEKTLLGEMVAKSMDRMEGLMENQPSDVVWTNLLHGREPRYKFLPGPTKRIRKKVHNFDDFFKALESEGDTLTKKRRVVTSSPMVELHNSSSNVSSLPLPELPTTTNPSNSHQCRAHEPASRVIPDTPINRRHESGQPPQSERKAFNLGNANIVPNSGNDECVQAPPGSIPLQIEMERLQKEKEKIVRMHEDTKLRLKSECEKEISEIRKKYDLLLQNAETEEMEKINDIETCYQKVRANKLLAEALSQNDKFSDEIGTEGLLQGFLVRPSQRFQQSVAPSPLDPYSSLPMRSVPKPHANPFAGNILSSSEFRAPAPHLRQVVPPQRSCFLPVILGANPFRQ